MLEVDLQGIIPPMVTPFDHHEAIDWEAFRSELRFLLSHDIGGISIGGSTGEGATLCDEELRSLITAAVAENHRNLPIIAGIIRNSTKDAVKAACIAREAGATALLVTPSFYHGATPQGNYQFFQAVGQETNLPLLVYNVVPSNVITPKDMLELMNIPQVVGIKQVGAEQLAAMCALDAPIRVFSACDDMLYPTYVCGACGAISAINTVVPELCVQQWQAYLAGDQQTAATIQRRLHYVFQAYFGRPFPGKIKKVISLLGRPVGRTRQPITEPQDHEVDAMKTLLTKAGLHP